MKRITFIIISLMIFSIDSYSQDFNCAKYYEDYCKHLKSDSTELPNYTAGYFYSGNNQDSTIMSIPDCINDLDAFCSGVEQALVADKLSIRQVGDPGHVSACSYASYENHGVYLTMTGDIIDDAGIFDENAGFNFIMKQRIQDSLGLEILGALGKKDSTWLEFNESQVKVLFETMTLESKTDSTIFAKINEVKLGETDFINLKGVTFIDALSKVNYSYDDLLKGIEMKSKGDRNKRAFMIMDFDGYSNPRFCKSRFNSRWTIPIKVNE